MSMSLLPLDAAQPPRTWRAKFADALRGWKYGIRGEVSFFVHFFFAVVVLAAAVVLQCSLVEWCLLLFCIGLVLTAELFNTALETLFRGLEPRIKERCARALDIAAGAVLMACITAAVIGSLVFLYRLSVFLDWQWF
jgi:diacylglycerol kinase